MTLAILLINLETIFYILTKYLLKKKLKTHVIEIDTESVEYLKAHYLNLADRIISKDFLKIDLTEFFGDEQVAIIGNFPYNISTQIVFKTSKTREGGWLCCWGTVTATNNNDDKRVLNPWTNASKQVTARDSWSEAH